MFFFFQERLDSYLQFVKGELERNAKLHPDKFDTTLGKERDSYCLCT